jgi:hypothetical protein
MNLSKEEIEAVRQGLQVACNEHRPCCFDGPKRCWFFDHHSSEHGCGMNDIIDKMHMPEPKTVGPSFMDGLLLAGVAHQEYDALTRRLDKALRARRSMRKQIRDLQAIVDHYRAAEALKLIKAVR